MLQIVTIPPHERGVLLRNSMPVRWLEPGAHLVWGQVRRLDLREGFVPWTMELASVVPADAAAEVSIPAEHRGLLAVDGLPRACLEPGRYLLWKIRVQAEVLVMDTRDMSADIPLAFQPVVPAALTRSLVVPQENRGLLRQNGRVVRLLEPGQHLLWWVGEGNSWSLVNLWWMEHAPELEAVLPPGAAEALEVPVGMVAIVSVDGVPKGCLDPGRYLLWQLRHRVTAAVYSTETIHSAMPERAWALAPATLLTDIVVHPYEKALLYIDGKLVELLETGRYAINKRDRQVQALRIDMREQELQIQGQEVMTADKVTLRLNLIVKYRCVDPVRLVENTANFKDSLYSEVQMAARRHVAGVTVDALLEGRVQARAAMHQDLREKEEGWGIEVLGLDLKDVILPGEMKALFNLVVEAEKRAAANVITRREETAATRSLANTARMLENNPTLLKLKELEALKDIADRVGSVTVVATPGDLLGKLQLSDRG